MSDGNLIYEVESKYYDTVFAKSISSAMFLEDKTFSNEGFASDRMQKSEIYFLYIYISSRTQLSLENPSSNSNSSIGISLLIKRYS